MKRIAIIGLGLMGGSLGLAIKRKRLPFQVTGYARRAETRRMALKRRIVQRVVDSPQEAVADADLVVFCLPVLTIPAVIRACVRHFPAGCIVTDVGSTKATLASELKPIFRGSRARFVGSHPIAGSDETGIEAARADLYDGALAVVADESFGMKRLAKPAIDKDVATVARFWRDLGMNVIVMPAKEHDRIIARTSHLPHLVAATLVSSVCRGECDEVARFCGSGFRDTTRIAGGSEDIWHDIVKTNSEYVKKALADFAKELARVRRMIARSDFNGVRRFLAQSRERRRAVDSILTRKGGSR
jgi:prephenate dehydrogenase